MNDIILKIDHVSKAFGKKVVLKDASISIRKGEFVTLLGPSGCGKTTLLRMIAGFELPSSGQILLEGKDINYSVASLPASDEYCVSEICAFPSSLCI